MAIRLFAFDQGKEFVLDFFGDGAAGAAADFHAIDAADGRDFDRGAAEKHFVDDVEHFARNDLLRHRNAQVLANGNDAGAGDAGQRGIRNGRSDDRAVVDHKNIFAGAFADLAVGIERNAFDVAVGPRFHANELRVHVIRGGLGHLRQSIRRGTIPGTDANVDTLGQTFFAQIFSPSIAGQVDLDGATDRIDAGLAVTAQNYRTNVAGTDFVDAQKVQSAVIQFLGVKRRFHAVNVGGVQQALDVFAQPKNGDALRRVVGADTFEDGGAVANDMREDVNLGVVPGDEFSVVPDLLGLWVGHSAAPIPRN